MTNDADNALRVIVKWSTSTPETSLVKYREASGDENTWYSTVINLDETTSHEVVVVGLKALTEYVIKPVSGTVEGDEVYISTLSLPSNFPTTQLAFSDGNSSRGVTIGGTPAPISSIIAVDSEGEIIWYHVDSEGGDPGDFHIGWDGRLFYQTIDAIKAVDFAGNEETLLSVVQYEEDAHHDFLITPEGTYMYLSHKQYSGITMDWCVDEIVERDYMGEKIWSWNVADHSSELGGLTFTTTDQRSVASGCGYDYSHSNSLFIGYDSFGSKYVILSARNLNRIIKIDYETGAVLWQLGDGLDFLYTGAEEEHLEWFYYQHSASIVSDGHLLLFDNGNNRFSFGPDNFTRVLIYSFDEITMQAQISWSYNFDLFADHSGNSFLIDNGNILVTFPTDLSRTYAAFVEINESQEVVWQTDFSFASEDIQNFIIGNLRISSLYDLEAQFDFETPVDNTAPDSGGSTSNDLLSDQNEIEDELLTSGNSNCLIETAAYGQSDRQIILLKEFRDNYLLKIPAGEAFVSFYYYLSPPLAGFIEDRPFFQALTRMLLAPFVFFLQYPLAPLLSIICFSVLFIARRPARVA